MSAYTPIRHITFLCSYATTPVMLLLASSVRTDKMLLAIEISACIAKDFEFYASLFNPLIGSDQ